MLKVTPANIRSMKGQKLPALTAYDFGMARLLDQADIPVILVGDSLGMVVLGYPDTTQVTLNDMRHHVQAVARAQPGGLIVADLPFQTYSTPAAAVESARGLIEAGAEAVKAEGGKAILPQLEALASAGIPFMGHIGMLPQSVRMEGGYRIKGKLETEHASLIEDARALESAGAFAVVLELVTPPVAAEITRLISIPTIGIGSGTGCDGQILVTTDLLGTSPGFIPRHVHADRSIAQAMAARIESWKNNL